MLVKPVYRIQDILLYKRRISTFSLPAFSYSLFFLQNQIINYKLTTKSTVCVNYRPRNSRENPGTLLNSFTILLTCYSVQSKWYNELVQKFTEFFDVLPLFVPTIWKSLTAENGPEGTRKSARVSESIIGMKIGPFVSYIKWPGELGSIGCVSYVFSTVCTFVPARPFFPQNYTPHIFRGIWATDCNVLTLRWQLHFAPICTTNQRWPISEPESCEQALSLPPYEAYSRQISQQYRLD